MKWVEKIHFKERDEFRGKLFENWKVGGKVVGKVKKAGLLEFRIVNEAGHMVPMDQPETSLEMVRGFVNQYKVVGGDKEL